MIIKFSAKKLGSRLSCLFLLGIVPLLLSALSHEFHTCTDFAGLVLQYFFQFKYEDIEF